MGSIRLNRAPKSEEMATVEEAIVLFGGLEWRFLEVDGAEFTTAFQFSSERPWSIFRNFLYKFLPSLGAGWSSRTFYSVGCCTIPFSWHYGMELAMLSFFKSRGLNKFNLSYDASMFATAKATSIYVSKVE